jgi:hypothetical protein
MSVEKIERIPDFPIPVTQSDLIANSDFVSPILSPTEQQSLIGWESYGGPLISADDVGAGIRFKNGSIGNNYVMTYRVRDVANLYGKPLTFSVGIFNPNTHEVKICAVTGTVPNVALMANPPMNDLCIAEDRMFNALFLWLKLVLLRGGKDIMAEIELIRESDLILTSAKLELGYNSTPYCPPSKTLAELELCRYYFYPGSIQVEGSFRLTCGLSDLTFFIPTPVPMTRTRPIVLEGDWDLYSRKTDGIYWTWKPDDRPEWRESFNENIKVCQSGISVTFSGVKSDRLYMLCFKEDARFVCADEENVTFSDARGDDTYMPRFDEEEENFACADEEKVNAGE